MVIVYICLGALAAGLLLTLLLTLGLATRVRELKVELGRAAMRDPALPQPGDPVGDFATTTTGAESISTRTLSGRETLVGIFAPGCSDCARVRAELLVHPPRMPFVAFIDCTGARDADTRAIADALAPIAKVVLTRQGEAPLLAFREAGVPTLIVVEDGVVTASGHRIADVLPAQAWAA